MFLLYEISYKKAKIAGVTTKELVEGVIVATSIETGSALLPSISKDIFQNLGVENQTEQLSELFPDPAYEFTGAAYHTV